MNSMEKIKKIVKMTGLKHAEIGEALGISQQAVSKKVCGESTMSITDFAIIAYIADMDACSIASVIADIVDDYLTMHPNRKIPENGNPVTVDVTGHVYNTPGYQDCKTCRYSDLECHNQCMG